MTINLQPEDGFDWQIEEEEYPVYFSVDSEFVDCQSIGKPIILLHRFGGSYGEVKYLLKAQKDLSDGEIYIYLHNRWGFNFNTVKLPVSLVEHDTQESYNESVENIYLSYANNSSSLTKLGNDSAVQGISSLAIKSFCKFLKDDLLKSAEQKIYEWSETYTKIYLKRHGQIQVLGMSQAISLDDIYTNVRMLDAETVKCLESVEGLEQVYRKANQRGFGRRESAKQKGIEVANAEQYLCVLGDLGIGKTTYLRKVGLEALLRKVGSYNHEQIPVFLELKRFRDPKLDIKTCIVNEFETCSFPDPEKFTEHALKSGDLLILLDGLNEVPSDNLKMVVQSIKVFSDQYPENRFITSCRTAAYHTYFTGFKTVAIAEFNDDQISGFIRNWFQADPNPLMTPEKKAEYANTIWEQLKTSDSIGTKELSQTPLLLTFVCLVFRQTKTITGNRAKLYSNALDILLEEWAKSKLLEENWEIYQDLSADLEKDMLASIAYVGFEEDKLFFEKDELAEQISAFLTDNHNAPKHLNANRVIDAIAVQQGIFIERATDVYSFSHLTLQEYLCAEYISHWNLLDRLVKKHATDERWREIFLLVAGLRGRAAIGLLEKLELQTQELSEHPKLKGLLAWAEAKTTDAASDYSGETKRVFTLIKVFAPVHVLDYALTFAFGLASDLAFDFTFDFSSELDYASYLTSELEYAMELTKICLRQEHLADANLTSLKLDLENLLDKSTVSREEFTSTISSSLDISPEFFDLSSDDVQVITNYLSTCQLMIDCSKQASGISAQQWEAIKQRMFLPKPAE
ncbi:NACHT domain-containing protein [Acaryochloris marina NIES-2412]|uniref:NACHT domain-containing protein n=1 Tax=Acaryochloris marina TaxID=155978 RepID=UPI004059B56E